MFMCRSVGDCGVCIGSFIIVNVNPTRPRVWCVSDKLQVERKIDWAGIV